MKLSKRNGRNQTGFVVLLLALSLAGCTQRESLPTSVETVSADQHLPFEGTSDKVGNFPTGSLTPTAIPAGTPVTIHLQLSLSSASSRPGDPFDAVLDEPIVVRGQTDRASRCGPRGKSPGCEAGRSISGTRLPAPRPDRNFSQRQAGSDTDFQHLREAWLARATQCDHPSRRLRQERRSDRGLCRCPGHDFRHRQHGRRRRPRTPPDLQAGPVSTPLIQPMWGGHSCPPPLTLILILFAGNSRRVLG